MHQQILDLYEWQPGTCFRHPDRGEIDTAALRTLHPRDTGDAVIRACRDCILHMEDTRRQAAERAGSDYEPGHAGEPIE